MMEHESAKLHLIQCTLSALVPIAIAELQRAGGPGERHLEKARAFGEKLGAEGDTLLYRVKGKTGPMMGQFCEVVAVLAFVPGGITVFGLHFEAKVVRCAMPIAHTCMLRRKVACRIRRCKQR